MGKVEEGISNFRAFQADARDFFSRADERAIAEKEQRDQREHRSDRKLNLLMAVIALLGLLLGYLTYRDSTRKNAFAPPNVSMNQPQDAGSSIAVHY